MRQSIGQLVDVWRVKNSESTDRDALLAEILQRLADHTHSVSHFPPDSELATGEPE